MEQLYDKSLTELHDLLVSKEITAVDLTEETLNRIQDPEEQLVAIVEAQTAPEEEEGTAAETTEPELAE